MVEHPDEDALLTAMDGTVLDVTVDHELELVVLTTGRGVFDLSPRGAAALARQLAVAAKAMRLGDIDTI